MKIKIIKKIIWIFFLALIFNGLFLLFPQKTFAVTNFARLSYTSGSSTLTDAGYVADTKTVYLTNGIGGTAYTLYWTTTNVTSGGGISLCTINVPALQTTGSCNITIPTTTKGTYYMHVESLVDNSDSAYTLTFTLSPKLTSISSSSGYVGDSVTVSGTGFAQETVTVKFGGYTFGTYAVSSNGNLSLTTTVPEMPYGSKNVSAEGTSSGTVTYLALTFTVSPKISLSANSGVYNTTITVSGTGFDASTTVTITWDGADTTTTVPSNSLGSFSTNYTPPNSAGVHTISAHDTAGHSAGGLTYVVINPSITISSSSGNVGDSITINGTAFKPSSTVTITWDGSDTSTTTTSSSTGTFSKAFTIPDAVYGNHTIAAHDADNNTAPSKTFTITPKITISQSSGPVGTSITVSGNGFNGSSTITLTWDGTDTSRTTITNSSGSFSSLSYTIPTTTGGGHNINAHDSAGHTATNVVFTITPTVSISSTSGHAGDTTTLSGDGFAGTSTITVVWKGSDTSTTTTSASNGTFSGLVFTIPLTETPGTYTITARDNIPNQAPNKNYTVVAATTPVITLSSNKGPSGSTITISGSGFSVLATTATIRWDGSSTSTTCSLSSGSFSNCSYTIPSATVGDHTIAARDNAAVPNTSANQTYTVTSGTLSISNPTSATFTSVTIQATSQQTTANMSAITVSDSRGSNAGWSATATVSNFSDGIHTISVTNLSITPGSLTVVSGSGTGVSSGSSHTFTSTSDTATLMNANVGYGNGEYQVSPSLQLTIPVGSYSGSYSATMTITVS